MKIYHVDGGAFVEPPHYKFHDAYFSVCDDSGNLVHFEKNIGDLWSGIAEYEAIKWVVDNTSERPITITSDCETAIAWARKGSSKKSKFRIEKLPLDGVTILYQHGNHADIWNAKNHSPKGDKKFYVGRYKEIMESAESFPEDQVNFLQSL